MKNINCYSQPDFYHFSEDSIILAAEAAKIINSLKTSASCDRKYGLDLCSGCGVVGLEFLSKTDETYSFDFCEIQQDFKYYLSKNILNFRNSFTKYKGRGIHLELINKHFNYLGNIRFYQKYDLVLCNPPYFYKKTGKYSKNKNRNLCRFLLNSEFSELIETILFCLKRTGKAFIIGRFKTDEVEKWNRVFLEKDVMCKIEIYKKLTSFVLLRIMHLDIDRS